MSTQPANSKAEVVLLTQPDCSLCDQAKVVLARLEREGLLTVVETDLTSPQGRDLAVRHGVLFAPGVLVDGRPFSYGRLSEKKLRRRLAKST